MAKKNLEEILKQIQVVVDTRENLDLEIHKYSVVYKNILNEVHYEVNNTSRKREFPKTLLEPHVEEYCKDVYNSFKSYRPKEYKINVFGTYLDFFVLIRPLNSRANPFTVVGVQRKTALKKLQNNLRTAFLQYLTEQSGRRVIQGSTVDNELLDLLRGPKTYYKTGEKKGQEKGRAGGLLERGHKAGGSVVEHELFQPKLTFSNEIKRLPVKQSEVAEKVLAELDFKMVTNPKEHGILKNGKLVVSIFDQSKALNSQQSNEEQLLRSKFQRAIKEVLNKVDWINLETSPSAKDIALGKLHEAAKKAGAKKYNKDLINKSKTKTTSKANKRIKGKLTTRTSNESLKGIKVQEPTNRPKKQSKGTNWLSIVRILNSKLPDTVQGYMVPPRLVYRTGRFANSVRIVGVETTAQGYPSFIYDYMREPYDVFDSTLGAPPWNTPERDPKKLIETSIREAARELAIGRFYLRRATL